MLGCVSLNRIFSRKERKDNVFNALFIVKCLCYCKLNVKHWIIMDAIIVSLVDFCKIFFFNEKDIGSKM